MNGYVQWVKNKCLLVTDAKVAHVSANGTVTVKDGKAALWADDLKLLVKRGQSVAVAQCYGLVMPGLILTRHIFQGLRRPLYNDGSSKGDLEKLAYVRRPKTDFTTERDKQTGEVRVVECECPERKTFVVIASPNLRHRKEFPDVDIWIDHWNWTQDSPNLAEAPIDWIDRYDRKLFTRT